MNIATVLRIMDTKAGGFWDRRFYIMEDYYLMANKLGFGLCAVMSEFDFEKVCKNCDGLIVPGSGTAINPKYFGKEPLPEPQAVDEYYLDSQIIKYFYEAGKPIFGVCGGHQGLNIFLGGTIRRIPDHSKHLEKGKYMHPINIEKGSFVYDVFGKERAMVNCHHNCEIDVLAPDLKVVASTDDGVIEAVEWKEKNIFATQWHPEQSFHRDDPIEQNFFVNFLKRCEECRMG